MKSKSASHPHAQGPKKGTIVRFKNFWDRGLKPLMQLTSTVAPEFVADLSEGPLSKPRRYRTSHAEQNLLDQAERGHICVHHHRVYFWKWGSGEKTALLLHGWEGRGIQLSHFVEPLLKAGYTVVTIDNLAHGESEGITVNVILYSDVILELAKTFGTFDVIVGHSMATAATGLAHHARPVAKKFVFIGASVDPIENFRAIATHRGVTDRAFKIILKRIETRYKVNASEVSMLKTLRNAEEPVLLIHDEHDRQASWKNAAALKQVVKNGELYLTHGLGHSRILKSDEVVQKTLNFVTGPKIQT